MKEQITYKLIDHVINPKYIGLIREYMPEDYELDKYASNPIPELVTEINNFFSDPCKMLDNSELFDCSSENDIYTIDFRNLNLDDRKGRRHDTIEIYAAAGTERLQAGM